MSPDEDRWAEALAVRPMHGERSALRVAERIGALAWAGDWPVVRR